MKKRERMIWIFPVLALIVGIGACSAQPSGGLYLPTSGESSLDKESREFLSEIDKAFAMIKKYYVEDVDSRMLYEGALRGMMAALEDPHSIYWDEEVFRGMQKDLIRGDYGGVGLYINKPNPKSLTAESDITDLYIQVIAPIRGTPGYFADLHAGDFITHIDGESVADLTSQQAVEKLTGEVGTDVMVTILRGKSVTFDVTLTRAKIEVPTIESDVMANGLGYLRLTSWTQHTAKDVEEALVNFLESGCHGLIVDLRENGGGLLEAAVEISNFFISDGPIVSTRYRASVQFQDMSFEANSFQTKLKPDFPVVVLIDKGSASASEIFAGAMQDSGRARIIGNTSYGKGSIQVPFPLAYNDSVKMTVGRYYTPSGKNIDQVGIVPDIELPVEELTDEELDSLQTLISEKLIDNFVEANPNHKNADVNGFVSGLPAKGIRLKERLVKKLIRNKYHRKMDFPPVYDLEYDMVLQKAVEVLLEGDQPEA